MKTRCLLCTLLILSVILGITGCKAYEAPEPLPLPYAQSYEPPPPPNQKPILVVDEENAAKEGTVTRIPSGEDSKGVYCQLTCDLTEKAFPTGSKFYGYLDGAGFSVKANESLFACLGDGAVITNLRIQGSAPLGLLAEQAEGMVTICGVEAQWDSRNNFYGSGGLIGKAEGYGRLTFSDCHVKGNYSKRDEGEPFAAGGLLGRTEKEIVVTFEGCTFAGRFQKTAAGGLLGECRAFAEDSLHISNCAVNAEFVSCGTAGGLVGKGGFRNTIVKNSHVNMTVKNGQCAGGAFAVAQGGAMQLSIDGCTFDGDYAADIYRDNAQCLAGGIIGYVQGGEIHLEDCTVSADIFAKGSFSASASAYIGLVNGESVPIVINDCVFSGTVEAEGKDSRTSKSFLRETEV